MIEALDHVQIAAPAGCEAAARTFFSGLLGLPEIPKPPALQGRGGVWFQVGDQQLHVGVEREFRPAPKAHAALRVKSPHLLAELAGQLLAAGHPVDWDQGLPEIRRFYTVDPWGNRLELLAGL